ncbi:MAG: hypothetical protein HY369_03585 [Candidatus Aenigmarchaeota archaeon]|nr:hypothetical protein [Candidatus Aenigmarchaeota archaeon]
MVTRDLIRAGERLYRKEEASLRKQYADQVIALDTETGAVCGSGRTLTEAAHAAHSLHPGRPLYFKRVGAAFTAHVL